jgi:hypothetical protein
MPTDNEVKISNGRETRVITMRHPPKPGDYLTIEDEPWLVVSVSFEVPYRIPAMSFIAERQAS